MPLTRVSNAPPGFVLRVIGRADGEPSASEGKFVSYYDPSHHPPGEEYDGGALVLTDDRLDAKRFTSAARAIEYWRQSYGVRADGKPNRPLTCFTVSVEPV